MKIGAASILILFTLLASVFFLGLAYANAQTSLSVSNPAVPVTFSKDLSLGDISADVLSLQKFLNTHGFPVAASGPGSAGNETTYFGSRTKQALILFQNANAARVLAPAGLSYGTGNFFSSTRSFVNALLQPPVINPTPTVSTITNQLSHRRHPGRSSNTIATPVTSNYTVGGTLSGLSGTVQLQNNAADTLTLSSNGSFAFATAINNLMDYLVIVFTQPNSALCVPSGASGTVAGANVTSVNVSCYTFPSITFASMTKFFTFATRTFTLSPTSDSGGAFTYVSSDPSVATISGSTVTMVGIGTTTITAYQATSSPYAASTTSATLQAYVDECYAAPCENGGTCTNVAPSSYSCSCADGYSGTNCELATYNCDGTYGTCFNGGTCVADLFGGSCSCTPDFTGTYCEAPSPTNNAAA